MTNMTSLEFNKDLGRAKKAALVSPVIVTNRGEPTHVLMSHAEYARLTQPAQSVAEAFAMPGHTDIEFNPEPIQITPQQVDLS